MRTQKRKNTINKRRLAAFSSIVLVIALLLTVMISAGAENAEEPVAQGVPGDTNPAISVAQKNQNSVVGVVTSAETWNRSSGETTQTDIAEGSGVVIKEGYILTNFHVIEDGNAYKVVLPSGERIDAKLKGADQSTDLAVLEVSSDELVPVTIGSSSNLVVGNTAIAIGNPGGSDLAHTVTSGIVSALERTSANTTNTTREIAYIQHDASINSGNSGGGLFNSNGELIGINTLKYQGNIYTGTYEGLGFAIPIDTAYPIAMDIIEHGKVRRPALGVTVGTQEGPDEPMGSYAPAGVCVYAVTEGSPAEEAGIIKYDIITEVDGVRVKNLQQLTSALDSHKEGDTVKVTLVRYDRPEALGLYDGSNNNQQDDYYNDFFGFGFGFGFGNGRGNNRQFNNSSSTWETITLDVTLKVLDD